jgi:hypothetical protein
MTSFDVQEDVNHLIEKLTNLQKEVFARTQERDDLQHSIEASHSSVTAASSTTASSTAFSTTLSPRALNLQIKSLLETYLAEGQLAQLSLAAELEGKTPTTMAVVFQNGKHKLRLKVGRKTTFGELMAEVKALWNVPAEKVFVLRDGVGNYWSPLGNVVDEFSALTSRPFLYVLHRQAPDKQDLEDFDPDKLLKTAAERFNRNAMLRNQGRSRFLVVDALKIIVFTAIFVAALIFGQNVLRTHKFIGAIKYEFLEKSFNGARQDTFYDISSATKMFEYLRGPFRDIIFPAARDGNQSAAVPGVINGEIFVIHALRFRQLRVYTDSCELSNAAGVSVHVGNCYDDYNALKKYPGPQKSQGDDSFGKPLTATCSNSTALNRESYLLNDKIVLEDATEASRFPKLTEVAGQYVEYPAEGYVLEVPLVKETFDRELATLYDCRWVDARTRVVFVEVNFYSPNIDQFCALKLVFEFSPSGALVPTSKALGSRLTVFANERDIPVLLLRIIVFAVCLTRFFAWRQEIAALVGQYGSSSKFFNVFTFMDVTMVGLVIQVTYRRVLIYLDWRPGFLFRNIDTNDYFEIYGMLREFQLIGVLEAWAVLLSFFILIKYCDIVAEGSLIADTLRIAGPSIVAFFVVFSLVLFGFTLLYHNIYGTQMKIFSDVDGSFRAMLLTLIGDVAFQDAFQLPWETDFLHDVLFFIFLMGMYYIMTSVFLGIMNEAHVQAQRAYEREKGKRQYVTYDMAFEVLFSWALPLQERITRGRAQEAEQEKSKLEMQSIVIERNLIK